MKDMDNKFCGLVCPACGGQLKLETYFNDGNFDIDRKSVIVLVCTKCPRAFDIAVIDDTSSIVALSNPVSKYVYNDLDN